MCANVTKVRWHNLAGQKSSIVIIQKKDVYCTVCAIAVRRQTASATMQKKNIGNSFTFLSFLKMQNLQLFVTRMRNLKYLKIIWLRWYKFVWPAENFILIYICGVQNFGSRRKVNLSISLPHLMLHMSIFWWLKCLSRERQNM